MKKLFFSLCAVALLSLSSCDKYDDGPLSNRVDNLENRVKSLEEQCKQLNANITSVQTLVNAMENGDAITSVTPIKEGDKEVGYSFAFSKSPSISVYHGKDGQDGASGSAPEIGIKKDDKGNYCWTINGEWIVGEDGNKVSSTGASDSVLPEFKIDKDNWLMSADGGETWVNLGKGTADGKNAVFNDIDTTDPNKVTFTLSDGTKFELPRQAELTITLSEDKQVLVKPNTTITIVYTIAGNTKDLYVEVITSGNVKAKIENNEATTGTITIKIGENIDEYDKLILFATNGIVTVFKSLTFKEDEYVQIIDEEEPSYVANEEGGAMNLNIETNTDYSVNIPDEAKDWISVVQSRAAIQATIKLNISANSSYTRSANIVIKSVNGKILLVIQIIQKGESIIPDDMTVAFPDVNFRKYLLQNFDIDSDGKISDVEAFKVKRIEVRRKIIGSLEGIQYFPNLEYLDCYSNQLTSLDVSNNTALTVLYCNGNQLTTLDLSKNTMLTKLYCDGNRLTTLDLSNNTALTYLNCSVNKLSTLDLSNNTALTELVCQGNPLTTLDVSNNTMLTKLYCDGNKLTTLELSKNTDLKHLYCYQNQLTSLNLSKNTALIDLDCSYNQLTTLDVTNNTALWSLSCRNNQLATLDVSKNTVLRWLTCSNNILTTLEVSNNTALKGLFCDNNKLTMLDVTNNIELTQLNCSRNQLTALDVTNNTLRDLHCEMTTLKTLYIKSGSTIQNLKKEVNTEIVYIGGAISIPSDMKVAFPDPNFRDYVLSNFDNDKDGVISNDEVLKVISIVVENKNIQSLEGIQYFPNLELLNCKYNKLISLDVTKNTALIKLDCYHNQLTTLDVSYNTLLSYLSCGWNQLTTLDLTKNTTLTYLNCTSTKLTTLDLSKNTALTVLYCSGLTMLDLSNNTVLTELHCSGNKLTTLDLTNNTSLTYLDCLSNQLTTLDVSKNTALTRLDCGSNKLTLLDISKNTALTELSCGQNQLTALNLTNNTALTRLDCTGNQLTTLDISNNIALTQLYCSLNQLTALDVTNNTLRDLHCNMTTLKTVYLKSGQTIQNLDKYSNTEIVYVGGAISIPSDMTVAFPDKNFRNYLIQNFDTDNDEVISDEEASRGRSIKVDNKGIYNLDGIQYFSKIERLECEFNKLSSLDLSHNTALKELICYRNELVSLDISKCTALTVLKCDNNQLTNLNLSNCVLLENLTCIKNPISFIDLSKCKLLQYLECSECQLTSLSLSSNTALRYVDCNDNQLIDLDVSKTNLGRGGYSQPLHCSMPTLKTLYIKNGWTIEGITYDRSVSYINPNTEIKYLN